MPSAWDEISLNIAYLEFFFKISFLCDNQTCAIDTSFMILSASFTFQPKTVVQETRLEALFNKSECCSPGDAMIMQGFIDVTLPSTTARAI